MKKVETMVAGQSVDFAARPGQFATAISKYTRTAKLPLQNIEKAIKFHQIIKPQLFHGRSIATRNPQAPVSSVIMTEYSTTSSHSAFSTMPRAVPFRRNQGSAGVRIEHWPTPPPGANFPAPWRSGRLCRTDTGAGHLNVLTRGVAKDDSKASFVSRS